MQRQNSEIRMVRSKTFVPNFHNGYSTNQPSKTEQDYTSLVPAPTTAFSTRYQQYLKHGGGPWLHQFNNGNLIINRMNKLDQM
jgi:hypothetical protein